MSTHLPIRDPVPGGPALFAGSRATDEVEALCPYMPFGPFADERAMCGWLSSVAPVDDFEVGGIWCTAAAERLRSTFEGLFRQSMVIKGRDRDTAWFSMLGGEWPAVRSNMERWLDGDPGSTSLRRSNARS